MKLLLTSAGIINESLSQALKNLVGDEIKTAFIPTAANVEDDDKDWLVKDLRIFQELGYVDIIDISAIPRSFWLKRIKKTNVVAVGGGNTTYLMEKIRESGFDKDLPDLLKTKTYVGVSAGSIVMSKDIWASSEFLFANRKDEVPKGLGYVDFDFRPHYNSPYFSKARKDVLEEISKKHPKRKIYACDDNSGLKVVDGKIEVISEGVWDLFTAHN